MPAQTARMFQHETDESFARVSRSRSDRIRSITYWTFTILLVWELVAGSLWNLQRIEWIRVQLTHLGYPVYLAYILGVWLIGAAAAIIAPGFPRLKEWGTRERVSTSRVRWRRTCWPATGLLSARGLLRWCF